MENQEEDFGPKPEEDHTGQSCLYCGAHGSLQSDGYCPVCREDGLKEWWESTPT